MTQDVSKGHINIILVECNQTLFIAEKHTETNGDGQVIGLFYKR